MISLSIVESIISLFVFFLAYITANTIVGYCKAAIAYKLGDDTAYQLGFLTLNPMAHIDPIGFFFLIIFRFGWGATVPVNPYNLEGKFSWLKKIIAYFSDVFLHIVMAIFLLVMLIIGFGVKILYIALPMIAQGNLSQKTFAAMYPHTSSFFIIIGMITVITIFFNILYSALSFLINGFRFLFDIVGSDKIRQQWPLMAIIVPMVIMYIFIRPLFSIVGQTVLLIGTFIAQLLGGI